MHLEMLTFERPNKITSRQNCYFTAVVKALLGQINLFLSAFSFPNHAVNET